MPFIKEESVEPNEQSNASASRPTHETLPFRAATPRNESSLPEAAPKLDSKKKEEPVVDSVGPDIAALEHALDTLTRFAPNHELAEIHAAFLVKKKFVGTIFSSTSKSNVKSTTKWAKKELKDRGLAPDHRVGVTELIREHEASLIAEWVKSQIKDHKTLRRVGTLLSQSNEPEEANEGDGSGTKRRREKADDSVERDGKRAKRTPMGESTAFEQDTDDPSIGHLQGRSQEEALLDAALGRIKPPQPPPKLAPDATNSSSAGHSLPKQPSSDLHGDDGLLQRNSSTLAVSTTPKPIHAVASALAETQLKHTTVPFLAWTPEPKRKRILIYVYIPINTPEMTPADPPVLKVEKACRSAGKKAFTLVWAKRLGERFWIACFSGKKGSTATQMLERKFKLSGQECPLYYLPSTAPDTFTANFSGAMSVSSDEIMRRIHAALPPKQALPDLVELTSRSGKNDSTIHRHFELRFAHLPGFMRLYIPVASPAMAQPWVGVFTAAKSTRKCVGCGASHGNAICAAAKLVPWPA
jgi:hypothetical protein